ncbi:MAG: hypothetical protein PHX60_06530 [Giesbergeria sp.]|nr:hypothetical protein [Giesbergeria sp.]
MKLIVSGEGPTDIGACNNAQGVCFDGDFSPGPMTIWLQRLWELLLGYDLRSFPEAVIFISETTLAQEAKRSRGRMQSLRGRHQQAETGLYYNNAKQLGLAAKKWQAKDGSPVIAVLFRDSDGTRSAPGQLWHNQWQSILDGFKAADFDFGVPMLPKPKSEVWMLACTQQGHPSYAALEDISGNDNAPRSAKSQLDHALGGHQSAAQLALWCQDHPSDWEPLQTMPSFKAFYARFYAVANAILHPTKAAAV